MFALRRLSRSASFVCVSDSLHWCDCSQTDGCWASGGVLVGWIAQARLAFCLAFRALFHLGSNMHAIVLLSVGIFHTSQLPCPRSSSAPCAALFRRRDNPTDTAHCELNACT
jgi:hypothetical protein